MDGHNFITRNGYRIWLDAPWLFSLITGMPMPGEFIEKNKKASAALTWIDTFMELRHSYAWYFALYCIMFWEDMPPLLFLMDTTLIFMLLMFLPVLPMKITLIETLMHILYFPYYICMNVFVRATVLIILAIVFHCPIFIAYYVIFYIMSFVWEYAMRIAVSRLTYSAYGTAYSDAELAAFRAVYSYIDNNSAWLENEKLNSCADVIRWYMKHVSTEE